MSSNHYTKVLGEGLRLLVVAGIPVGVFVAGLGILLRLTRLDAERGIQSDDDFTIERFTLTGTYNLLVLDAAIGIIGAAASCGHALGCSGRGGFAG